MMRLLDANILSVFAKLGRLELLFRVLGPQLAVSSNVYSELQDGLALGYEDLRPALELIETGELGVVPIGDAEQEFLLQVPFQPEEGEADSLAWCLAHAGAFVTSDKRAARRASDLGVHVVRQRDILRELWVKGILSVKEVRSLVAEMETRLSVVLLDQDEIFADELD
jgi:predicted nucleic acid-binding protein